MAKLLKESDLFVVQLQDTIHAGYVNDVVSVTFDTLKDSIIDLAIPGTRDGNYSDGRAGVMYPGQGFYYDESDGRLDVRVDSDLQFIGVITQDTSTGSGYTEYDPSYATATGDPRVSRGNFYVVGEPGVRLDSTVWYPLGSEPLPIPNLGDLVVCVDDSVPGSTEGDFDSHAWNVIPNVTGGQAVLEIRASAPEATSLSPIDPLRDKDRYVQVDTSVPLGSNQRPVVRVRQAGFITVPSDTVEGGYYVGGLIDEYDKEKIDKFDLNVYQSGWVASLNIRLDKPSRDSLRLQKEGIPNYQHHMIGSNPAEENRYGVIEIATQSLVDEAIVGVADSVLATGRTDEVAMTPLKTIENFVPRLFNSLPNIETAAQNLLT